MSSTHVSASHTMKVEKRFQQSQITSKGTPSRKTVFRIGFTPSGIFLAVRCREPLAKTMKLKLGDGKHIFAEDSIEFFLSPTTDNNYIQFAANAIGSRWNGTFPQGDLKLKPWKAAAKIGKTAWTIEVLIPFHVLGQVPFKKGEYWNFNVCRNIRTGGNQLCSWAPVKSGFHEPERFGRLIFDDQLTRAERRKALKQPGKR